MDDTLHNLDNYNSHLKTYRCAPLYKYYTDTNCNIYIVDDILKFLLKNQDILTLYKKLCYSIFVEKNPESIIFNEYYDNKALLTEWLKSTSYLSCVSFINGNDYYNEIQTKSNLSKNISKYRFVIIHQTPTHHLLHLVKFFEDLGFINIIICYQTNSSQSIYNNFEDYKNYLSNNVTTIRDNVPPKFSDNVSIMYYEDVFMRGNLLGFNFLKWCCHK